MKIYEGNSLNKSETPESRYLVYLDNTILFFITLQVVAVGFSIAVASISLGFWFGLWIIKLLFLRKVDTSFIFSREMLYVNSAIAFYILAEFISRLFAVFPDEAIIGLKRQFLVFIIFGSVSTIRDKNTFYKIFFIVVFGSSIVSLYEIVRFAVAFRELAATVNISEIRIDYLNYPITGAEIKMLIFLTAFPLLFSGEKMLIKKWTLVSALIPILIAMYLTQSRNVMLAVFICFIITAAFFNKKFLLYLVILTAAFIYLIPGQFRERIFSIADPNHPSNQSRIVTWQTGIKMFKDYPVTGVGDNEITEVYKMYKTPELHGEGSHMHSNYMQILVTSGILGAIAYILFHTIFFMKQIKYYKVLKDGNDGLIIFGTILMMISFHISGIFEWNFGDWEVFNVFMYLLSLPFILFNLNKKIKTD